MEVENLIEWDRGLQSQVSTIATLNSGNYTLRYTSWTVQTHHRAWVYTLTHVQYVHIHTTADRRALGKSCVWFLRREECDEVWGYGRLSIRVCHVETQLVVCLVSHCSHSADWLRIAGMDLVCGMMPTSSMYCICALREYFDILGNTLIHWFQETTSLAWTEPS